MLAGALLLFYVSVDEFNRFEGGDETVFELDAAAAALAAETVVAPTDVCRGPEPVGRAGHHGRAGTRSRAGDVGDTGDRR